MTMYTTQRTKYYRPSNVHDALSLPAVPQPQLTAHPSPAPQLTFVPREKILDNSIAVQVHDTLYHLPRDRLAQHSEYFANLIAKIPNNVPRNATGPDQGLDRCPVLRVTGVSSKDFEALLKAFDNIGYVFINRIVAQF